MGDPVILFFFQRAPSSKPELYWCGAWTRPVYEESFYGLLQQLKDDLGRQDLNFIIGRLSDFDMKNKRCPHWTMLREIQMKVADANTRGVWINTDDLNTGKGGKGKDYKDDLHMTVEGYKVMGKRFAGAAIQLIEKNQ